MPSFSKKSMEKLRTCDIRLQVIALEAIKEFDFVVVCGTRTPEEQQALFAQGRTTAGSIVTQIDGVAKKSKHNYSPSQAMDLAPFPIDWNNLNKFAELAKVIKRIAKENNTPLEWGGDWKSFKDYPHFQLTA